MKKNIHPQLNLLSIHCRCGHEFKVHSSMTQGALSLERCGKCATGRTDTYHNKAESARERLFAGVSFLTLLKN